MRECDLEIVQRCVEVSQPAPCVVDQQTHLQTERRNTSLRELCEDIIPASNFEGNEELVALAEEAKSLYRYNPEALKTTTGAQKSIAKQAKALEKKLNDFM